MDTDQKLNKHEMSSDTLSALADGQLRGTAFAQAVDRVLHDDEAQATWRCYHLIGDVLRSGELARCDGDSAFLARLQGRLKQEPGFTRPVQAPAQVLTVEAAPQRADIASAPLVLPVAANEPTFRWKMVAGFASMAAVAAIGWNLVGAPGMPGASSPSQQIALVSAPTLANVSNELAPMAAASPIQLVQFSTPMPALPIQTTQTAQAVTLSNGEPQVMIRDKRLDELLAAHKQFGGTSALQMPAGFLRNATFDVPAR